MGKWDGKIFSWLPKIGIVSWAFGLGCYCLSVICNFSIWGVIIGLHRHSRILFIAIRWWSGKRTINFIIMLPVSPWSCPRLAPTLLTIFNNLFLRLSVGACGFGYQTRLAEFSKIKYLYLTRITEYASTLGWWCCLYIGSPFNLFLGSSTPTPWLSTGPVCGHLVPDAICQLSTQFYYFWGGLLTLQALTPVKNRLDLLRIGIRDGMLHYGRDHHPVTMLLSA